MEDIDVTDHDAVYIICTTHEELPLPSRYISYNFEQLTVRRDDPTWIRRLLHRFRGAYEVWDYSTVNVKYLQSRGIDAKFLPLGYAPVMMTKYTEDVKFETKTVDFLFMGALNDVRRDKMKPITDLYIGNR